jgi:hypothetical protein
MSHLVSIVGQETLAPKRIRSQNIFMRIRPHLFKKVFAAPRKNGI